MNLKRGMCASSFWLILCCAVAFFVGAFGVPRKSLGVTQHQLDPAPSLAAQPGGIMPGTTITPIKVNTDTIGLIKPSPTNLPPSIDPEALFEAAWTWTITKQFKATLTGTYGAPPSGDTSTATLDPSDPSGTEDGNVVLHANLKTAGYWQIKVRGHVEFTYSNSDDVYVGDTQELTYNIVACQIDIYRDPTGTTNGTLVTDTTITEVVGHKVYLKAVLTPSDANSPLALTPLWTVPGDTVNKYKVNYVAGVSSSTELSRSPKTDATASTVLFYWYTGGANRSVIVQFQVGTQYLSGQVTFNVAAPTVASNAMIFPPPWRDTTLSTVRFGRSTPLPPPVPPDYPPYAQTPGIWFHHGCTVPVGFTGTFQYTQVAVQMLRCHGFMGPVGEYYQWESPQSGLDTTYPYPYLPAPFDTTDMPSEPYNGYRTENSVEVQDSFKMYLTFKPTIAGAGPDDVIDVPLWNAAWNWSGSAAWSLLGGWTDGSIAFAATITRQGASSDYPEWSQLTGSGIMKLTGTPTP